MEMRSFRDILQQMLEEKSEGKSEFPSRESTPAVETAPFFEWIMPRSRGEGSASTPPLRSRNGYATTVQSRKTLPQESATISPPAPAPAPLVEKLFPLTKLSTADRHHARVMIQLGATELNEGLSLPRVKKAYRRLAKQLHPDRGGKREMFHLLQSAYDALSALAYDNGSASAEASQRRDAA